MFLRSRSKPLIRILTPICLTLVLLALAVFAVASTREQMASESLRLTAESVRRAAVQCYALEGAYAMNLQYLIDNYGIRPDLNRFIVHYVYFGDNILPEISVIPISGKTLRW